jgi:hypothetical protein
MSKQDVARLRQLLVALKRSIDPHISDPRRVEILRSDIDPIWQEIAGMGLIYMTPLDIREGVKYHIFTVEGEGT